MFILCNLHLLLDNDINSKILLLRITLEKEIIDFNCFNDNN